MNKSILKAVAVSAVAVMFSLGCNGLGGTPPDEGEEGNEAPQTKTYTLTINASPDDGGTVSSSNTGDIEEGTSVTVWATANDGYTFSNWSGASSSTNDQITITMDGNKTLTAHFQEDAASAGGIVGDWSVVSMEYDGNVQTIPDDFKWFYSLNSSNDLVTTQFNKVIDFWIESVEEVGKYSIIGDSVCAGGECNKYSIFGDTLKFSTLGRECNEQGCYTYTVTSHAVRENLASTRSSLGTIYSQDSKLKNTEWEKPSSDPECEWCGDDRIEFWSQYFYDNNRVYIPDDAYDAAWYTEGGNRLTLVAMECDGTETVTDEWGEWENCVSYAVSQTITLDYQLTNGTLRLKATGKDWDTWTPYSWDDGMNKSKAKAKPQKSKRSVNPFKVSRK